jgi:hypothetical protein
MTTAGATGDRGQRPREQVEGELLAVDDDRVAGIVSALVADAIIDRRPELVGRLAFAFVAPLGSARTIRAWHPFRSVGPGLPAPTPADVWPTRPDNEEAPAGNSTGALRQNDNRSLILRPDEPPADH